MKVLLVEDELAIADALLQGLPMFGFEVVHVTTGTEALASHADVEVVLLDLGLPDMDGIDVCRRIRAVSDVPLIITTARGDEVERVVGLELGADDYLTKPFGLRELVARMRAVLRRTAPAQAGAPERADPPSGATRREDRSVQQLAALRIDRAGRRVRAGEDEVALTPKEFDLLAVLAEAPGVVLTREDLISRVWDPHWFGSTRTLDVHIGSLRRKLAGLVELQTVRGVGFRLELPAGPGDRRGPGGPDRPDGPGGTTR